MVGELLGNGDKIFFYLPLSDGTKNLITGVAFTDTQSGNLPNVNHRR
jgi:hypothetical protein